MSSNSSSPDWTDDEWLWVLNEFPPDADWRHADAAVQRRRAQSAADARRVMRCECPGLCMPDSTSTPFPCPRDADNSDGDLLCPICREGLARELPKPPLTARQSTALILASRGFVSTHSSGSMPSLERRRLVERERVIEHGRRHYTWRVTQAGHDTSRRLVALDSRVAQMRQRADAADG